MPHFSDEEDREYVKRVEEDKFLPAKDRLKLLMNQGLWSERLWEESKVEVTEKIQESLQASPAQGPAAIRAEAQPDLTKVKLNLADDKTRIMMESLNFLSARYPDTPSIIAMQYLQWNRQLLSDLLEHLRKKGLVIV